MIYNMIPQAGDDLPKGIIVMWSGAVNAIPDGWALCDGTNGTPDLRGRFVLGAGGSYAAGSTGGEERHTLTISEMPAHSHNLMRCDGGTGSSRGVQTWIGDNEPSVAYAYSAGGNQSHNNMPPYYALAYIMKL